MIEELKNLEDKVAELENRLWELEEMVKANPRPHEPSSSVEVSYKPPQRPKDLYGNDL